MNNKNKTGMNDRQIVQANEGYENVSSNVPGDRIQNNKQVVGPDQLGVDVTHDNIDTAPKAARKLKESISIKPTADVEELDGKQIGGVPLSGGMATLSAAGAGSESMVNDRSRAPYNEGGYRPDARFGRKIADKTFVINNAISEQIDPQYDESKALYEDPSAVQGYIGRKKFNISRGKKNVGKRPQDLLYFRSVDFVNHDEAVYTTGQIIGAVDFSADYPTTTYVVGDKNYSRAAQDAQYVTPHNVLKKGNYTPKTFSFDLVGGKIKNPKFNEARYEIPADRNINDVSNVNWQVDANNIANSMIRLQKELGRETTDKWSPLGYVIRQGYQVNALMHDIEATTGAYAATAYRAATSAMAHQINMIAKEGADPSYPAIRMVMEGMGKVANTDCYYGDNISIAKLFGTDFTKKGAVTAIIKMFDSTSKYKTKADLLTAQRSLKYMLSVADNNIDPFYVKKEFMHALNVAHTYSTFDGKYNPALPIYNTEWIELTNPLSLNFFLENWQNPSDPDFDAATHDGLSGCYNAYTYQYSDIRNNMTMPIHHPLVDGIMKWLLDHQAGLCAAYYNNGSASNTGTVHVEMPVSFNMSNPTMFAWIVCAAMQDIAYMRNLYLRDVLFAGEQSTYIWDDLSSLKEINPLWSTQLTIGRYDEAIKLGALCTAGKIRCAAPEHFMVHDEDVADGATYIMPWYMNENQFDSDVIGYSPISNAVTSSCMTMPSIRNGVRHEYLDLLYSVTERDLRLCLDRMTTIPLADALATPYHGFQTGTGSESMEYVPTLGTFTTGEFDKDNTHIYALRYDDNSDGRVVVHYDGKITHASLACTPRELGFLGSFDTTSLVVFDYTDKLLYVDDDGIRATYKENDGNDDNDQNGAYEYVGDASVAGDAPWSIASYFASPVVAAGVSARQLQTTAALKQIVRKFWASRKPSFVSANEGYVRDIGFAPCFSATLNGNNSTVREDLTICDAAAPINGLVGDTSIKKFFTLSSILYPILQRVFFVTNPFENMLIASGGADATAGAYTDPMEVSFLFGMCGTLASDFSEDVNARLDKITQLGIAYTEDEFITSSLIFRE